METYLTYQDKWGRFHDKPCYDGKYSSNNGWTYSSYAQKVGLELNYFSLQECFNQCLNNGKFVNRSPNDPTPPPSREEILGLASLGFLKPQHLNGWNFSPRPIPKFNAIKLLQQLWQLRPSIGKKYRWEDGEDIYDGRTLVWKHRNYFWENNLDQIYRFAFSVPLVDRHFLNQQWGEFCPFYWFIAKCDSLLGKESGIRYLKYSDEASSKRKVKLALAMVKEFPEDHPIREKLGL